MKATILDTKTGKTSISYGPRSYEWAEGNWSCDCNRHPIELDTGKPEDTCEGCERFIIISAQMNAPDDYPYTLAELNHGYPKTLLEKYGIIVL